MIEKKTRIAVMVSGGGTNLQALIDAQAAGKLAHGKIVLVVSNKPGVYALERAEKAGIPAVVCDKKALGGTRAFETAMLQALRDAAVELVVFAGFLAIVTERFVSCFPDRIVNIHPSLIPAFCGKGMYGLKVHEAALARGVKVTGATVHMVNEIPDGGRILCQKAVRVRPGDTAETLQRRVMEQAEWVLLPRAVEQLCKDIQRKGERYAPVQYPQL